MDKNIKNDQSQKQNILQAGTPAPDFTLPVTNEQSISLHDYRGQPVILAFYPADFSPVCGDQMSLYNNILREFQKYNAQLLGISVDGIWAHQAFAKDRNLRFPLLSDFEPKGEISRLYGVYNYEKGKSYRALFVIDPEGIIRWSYISLSGANPGADGILEALEMLHQKER